MNKLILVLGCFCIISLSAFGQQAQLSANLQQFLYQSSSKNLVLSKKGDVKFVAAFIKVNNLVSEQAIAALGVSVGTKAGNVWTVQIPVEKVNAFILLKGIDVIQLDEPIAPNMEAARKSSRVDSVQDGIGLPMAYSGKNVVVGIIDAGFDYGHPTFYDTTGKVLRIKKIWEQHNAGTPPAGYTYGNEITDTSAMLAKGYETNTFSHGTHVGGIAAGSGFGGLGKKYRGVAYESDLVFVGIKPEKSEWKSMGMTSIVDAINYIFKYAESVGKPAVANLSWGCSIGPNNGTSLFSQACDNLTGQGRIFVNSAGNNGDENIHLEKTFTPTDTVVHTFLTFPVVVGQKRTWVDVWGETNKTFCIELSLYNLTTRGSSTQTICLNNTTKDTFLVGTDNDTCFMAITTKVADYNGQPHVLLDLYSKTANQLCISLTGTAGRVHMWQGIVNEYSGYYGAFTKNNQSWATDGNNQYTLGEMACTKSSISVAAYVSKNSFRNLSGSNQSYVGYAVTNQIAPFSSKGPTADGRIKPDIAAPGMTIASAVNSYDVSYITGGSNYAQSVFKYTSPKNSRDYYYAEASGTSMSSPMVSGIVALLLQVNPKLAPQHLKNILFETAIKDNFTTTTPDSSRWGAGKINAYAAIKKTILTLGVQSLVNEATLVSIYPNPSTGLFTMDYMGQNQTTFWLEVTNTVGQTVYEQPWVNSHLNKQITVDLSGLNKGVYYATLSSNNGKVVRKIVLF
jgi:minor extracellular serine protease Vpr